MSDVAAGWYPDPSGRHEQRYWDGTGWTEQVASRGAQSADPLQGPPAAAPVRVSSPEKVRRQVEKQAGIAPFTGGGTTLFDAPVLVVNQKAKLIELTNEYAVYAADGTQLGSVSEVGQGMARKALRLLTQVDQYLTHRLEVRDAQGRVVLALTRPGKVFKSRVVVNGPDGREIGQIRQENVFGKIRFAFEVDGRRVGGIQAENWRAWDFAVLDAEGGEVARIKKTFEGLAKALLTTADNYVVRIHRPLDEPLRSLVVAAAVTVDTALKQDDR
jgi:uncharacterized protein YxjI